MIEKKDNHQLTIAELIAELEQYPHDALVEHEGCDCNGAANGVLYYAKANTVIITRLPERNIP